MNSHIDKRHSRMTQFSSKAKQSKAKQSRNYAVDFLKVFFMFLIIEHHGAIGGTKMYMAVDFFFFVSGFFTAKSLFEKEQNPGRWFLERLRRLYPNYILAYVILALYKFLEGSIAADYHPLYEIFLIQNIGLPEGGGLNYPLWYLSVLIWGGWFLYLLMWALKGSYRGSNIAIAGIGAIGYAILMYNNMTSIEQWKYSFGFMYQPIIRGVSDLAIGILIYQFVSKHEITLKMDWAVACLAVTVILMATPISDYVILLIEMILATIALSRKSMALNAIGRTNTMRFLSKYEYPVYLNHALIILMVDHIGFLNHTAVKIITIPIGVLLFSIMFEAVRNRICEMINRRLR